MNKIPFENGTLVTPAKVNEDNTITPAVYEGTTPLTSHNLNLLQDNIESEIINSGVVINSTEPTDNRKKVWLQKGENLFDNVFRQGSTLTNSLNNTTRIFSQMSIPLKANKTYKIYSDLDFNTYKFGFYTSTLKFPLSDSDELKTDSGWQYNSNVSYTPSEDEFMGIQVARIDNGNLVPTDISNFIFRIEIEKVIYVKNDNGIYEEFIKVNNTENFSNKVTFNETPANVSFLKNGNVVEITYQGESKTHSQNDILFVLPTEYRPTIPKYFPFVKNAEAFGIVIIATDGNCDVNQISSTTANGRIYFTVTYIV